MSQEFVAILDYMEKEKGIKKEDLIAAVENALLAAARKSVGPARDLRVELDPRNGKIRALANLLVVEKVTQPHDEITLAKARGIRADVKLGEIVPVEVTPRDFGRIAAQVFKQAMNQTLRGIERSMVFNEFKDRMGAIVTGTVRRFERSDVIVDLGKFEAVMPAKERVPTEEYTPGERIRAYVVTVENTQRGPEIILSRSHPDFVRKLFELEVSELNDKTVEIKGLAREAGYRTKIAVWSSNEKVDPVGACVGLRGSRVKNIVRELNNEKVDLFRWSPNIRELAVEALKPAKLKSLEVDEVHKRVKVIVDEENLSLAIGRRGQNARLTQKLTGWEIDIQKEQSTAMAFEDQLNQAAAKMAGLLQIEAPIASQVVRAGFLSIEGIQEVDADEFSSALPEVDPELARKIHETAVNQTKATPAS
ncbi:MAG: transcription termination/antitermination protein NusA [Verrucomicrobia bacterium Tous-C9LFEB]|nr:MAG: transcription termination/antitermination protein NusA [Verrucomicrobia bacterium Tous-C9LFEB]